MTPIEIKILFFKSVCPWLSSNQQNYIIHALYLLIPELFNLVHIMFSTIGKRLLSKAYWRSENFLTHSRLTLNQKKMRKASIQTNKQTTYWHFSPLHTWIPDNIEKIRMSKSNVKVVSCMNSLARTANLMKLCAHDVLICVGKSPGLWKILWAEEQYGWKLNTCIINFNILSCQFNYLPIWKLANYIWTIVV